MRILIIDDEIELVQSICYFLKTERYVCDVATTYQEAINKIGGFDYDCILLDITLPDGNGLNILRELKKSRKIEGVIIISAKDSTNDKIEGLNLGADDYLTKPFHLSELSARIAAIIRRKEFLGYNNIIINDIEIDTTAKVVSYNNKPIPLTKTEYELFLYLAVNKNRVISKSAIAEHISADGAQYFDSLDFVYAHIKNLKKKILAVGAKDNIKSLYGMGYKMEYY